MEHHSHHVEHKPHHTEKELRKKDWRFWNVIGSFLLDMLPIIFGILIAVGINNWREHRSEKKQEVFYLKIIQGRLKFTLQQLLDERSQYGEVAGGHKIILRTI